MRLPKSQLTENQYTSGGEYILPNNSLYKGYYWINNGRYFVGKTFDLKADELQLAKNEVTKINISNNLPSSLPNNIFKKIINSL
jgi:predicted porin